jgi:hypothetical protein
LTSGKEEKSGLVEAKACFSDAVQNQKDSLARLNELLEVPVSTGYLKELYDHAE